MKGWLENPPALFCAGAVAFATGVAVAIATTDHFFGLVIALWAVVFGIAAVCIYYLPKVAPISPVWRWLEAKEAIIRNIALGAGFIIGVPCLGNAAFFYNRIPLVFLASLFWGLVCINAGLLAKRIGVRRTLALGLLLGAGMYLMTAVYFLDQGNTLFVYFNMPWALLFGAVAFALDRGRNVAKELAPPEARESEPPGGAKLE